MLRLGQRLANTFRYSNKSTSFSSKTSPLLPPHRPLPSTIHRTRVPPNQFKISSTWATRPPNPPTPPPKHSPNLNLYSNPPTSTARRNSITARPRRPMPRAARGRSISFSLCSPFDAGVRGESNGLVVGFCDECDVGTLADVDVDDLCLAGEGKGEGVESEGTL
ncbi:uncharacterized protein J3D65DRAFT_236092 [Phyllosticta citribraziliensis]|uniref:Uncharacterized protein n=1 Tax=Phyllosticta citribraziliensis TaxID=989973 RepID=A0ABR1LZ56_9PEZI